MVPATRAIHAALFTVPLLLAGGAHPAEKQPITRQAAFARAVDLLRMGGDHSDAVQMLDTVARLGDARAQVLLGVIYLQGQEVAQDKVLGFAWLKVATQGGSYFDEGSREKAEAMMRSAEPAMTGAELIRADQLAASLVAEREQRAAEGFRRAVAVFSRVPATRTVPVVLFAAETAALTPPGAASELPLFRVGCAAGAGDRCPRPEEMPAGPRCTGVIVKPDLAPSAVPDPGTRISRPDYPIEARRWGLEGITQVLVHSDRSGWVCGVALANSSGVPGLDRAAVEAVSRWRIKPAMRGAERVEALSPLSVTFRLHGYQFEN
jgi:TonB family protein